MAGNPINIVPSIRLGGSEEMHQAHVLANRPHHHRRDIRSISSRATIEDRLTLQLPDINRTFKNLGVSTFESVKDFVDLPAHHARIHKAGLQDKDIEIPLRLIVKNQPPPLSEKPIPQKARTMTFLTAEGESKRKISPKQITLDPKDAPGPIDQKKFIPAPLPHESHIDLLKLANEWGLFVFRALTLPLPAVNQKTPKQSAKKSYLPLAIQNLRSIIPATSFNVLFLSITILVALIDIMIIHYLCS